MALEMTGDEWIELAKRRVTSAMGELEYSLNVSGPTKSSLVRIYSELEAASQHLLDAGFAYGMGTLR